MAASSLDDISNALRRTYFSHGTGRVAHVFPAESLPVPLIAAAVVGGMMVSREPVGRRGFIGRLLGASVGAVA